MVFLLVLVGASPAMAVTSTISVPSKLGGNGHNISFDGRVLMARTSAGWVIRLLRPEAVTYLPQGLPDAMGPMLSDEALVLPGGEIVENALAICEPDPQRAPFRCNEAGAADPAGVFDCYDFQIIDSDAITPADQGGFVMRRRSLMLWVADPRTAAARVHKLQLSNTLEPLGPTPIRGIEPTVTRDGKLMIWQGHPDNDGAIDTLMYSVNDNACAAAGWSAPQPISSMATDDRVVGTYRLADRALRAADGSVFAPGQVVFGAYPWLMPEGDAVIFAASPMPCRATEDPPGCGPRRNSMAVLGYPTNWGVAIIDGGINPAADDTVRLFFSSPGPTTFAELPVTEGLDVWPLFGTNTSNYVELIFDDGLDGDYAGFWHFNENVTASGELDLAHVPDVSGYFNTGALAGGVGVSTRNNGVVGRALELDGIDDRMIVDHSITLEPTNGITIAMHLRPSVDPDCDAGNNYRLLVAKGDIGSGSYSVVFEENRALHFRFNIDGEQRSLITPPVPLGQWSHVSCEYDGVSGMAGCWIDDVEVGLQLLGPGTLTPSGAPLTVGAPGARAACPAGDGAFAGGIDELAISRYARHLGRPDSGEPDAGPGTGPDAGDDENEGDGDNADPDPAGGCGCRAAGNAGGIGLLGLIALAAVRTGGRRRRSPRRSRRATSPARPARDRRTR